MDNARWCSLQVQSLIPCLSLERTDLDDSNEIVLCFISWIDRLKPTAMDNARWCGLQVQSLIPCRSLERTVTNVLKFLINLSLMNYKILNE